MHKLYAGIATGIVVIALIWGFVIVGSPMSERQRKFDDRRIDDLRVIHQAVMDIVHEGQIWDRSGNIAELARPFPDTLADIASMARFQKVNVDDPQTGDTYEYVVTGKSTYELCAVFNESRDEPYDVSWNHPAGRHCFVFDAMKPDGATVWGEDKPIVPSTVD